MSKYGVILSLAVAGIALQGCERSVSYQNDVNPLLKKYCIKCHTPGQDGFTASGLNMQDYETLMKGTQHGPVIKAGDSFTSALVMLVEGRADPSIKMPHGEEKGLTADEIETLKLWIDQGAQNN